MITKVIKAYKLLMITLVIHLFFETLKIDKVEDNFQQFACSIVQLRKLNEYSTFLAVLDQKVLKIKLENRIFFFYAN